MPQADNWNIMTRRPEEAHFSPVWSGGTSERNARREYAYMETDSYYTNYEYQLVNNYTFHYEEVTQPNASGVQVTVNKLIIDGWVGVPV